MTCNSCSSHWFVLVHIRKHKKVRHTNSGLAVCTVSLSQRGHAPCNTNFKTGWKGLTCDSMATHSLLPLLGTGEIAGWCSVLRDARCCIIIQLTGNVNVTVTFQGLRSFPSRAHPVILSARLPSQTPPTLLSLQSGATFYKSGGG